MRFSFKLLFFALLISFIPLSASAFPTYIYEQTSDPRFHMHIDFGASRGLTVAWFRVTPSVQTLKSWKCHYDGSRYKLRCPEPGGAIQYFNLSSDKKWLNRGQISHRLIKVVNQ